MGFFQCSFCKHKFETPKMAVVWDCPSCGREITLFECEIKNYRGQVSSGE